MSHNSFLERFRRYWYPIFHKILIHFGGYGVGHVYENQFVARIPLSEHETEAALMGLGFKNNALAAYKSLPDGRESQGSYRVTHHEYPELVEEGMQLHITVFHAVDGNGVELYAHYEDDWMHDPSGHLKADNFSAEAGVEKARKIIRGTLI